MLLGFGLSVLSEQLKQLIRWGSRSSEGLEIGVFFMVLNVFVGKQVCSGKPRNKKEKTANQTVV